MEAQHFDAIQITNLCGRVRKHGHAKTELGHADRRGDQTHFGRWMLGYAYFCKRAVDQLTHVAVLAHADQSFAHEIGPSNVRLIRQAMRF